jgi:hypothetical protein
MVSTEASAPIRCPACQSLNGMPGFDAYETLTYFCQSCEHVWTVTAEQFDVVREQVATATCLVLTRVSGRAAAEDLRDRLTRRLPHEEVADGWDYAIPTRRVDHRAGRRRSGHGREQPCRRMIPSSDRRTAEWCDRSGHESGSLSSCGLMTCRWPATCLTTRLRLRGAVRRARRTRVGSRRVSDARGGDYLGER